MEASAIWRCPLYGCVRAMDVSAIRCPLYGGVRYGEVCADILFLTLISIFLYIWMSLIFPGNPLEVLLKKS